MGLFKDLLFISFFQDYKEDRYIDVGRFTKVLLFYVVLVILSGIFYEIAMLRPW